MYYYLMTALKRKVLRELKDCFTHYFPQHQDIVPNINHKYTFDHRPQKGIVVTNASANPNRLSADNFQGTITSYVMLAGLENQDGLAIEWVKEDTLLLRETQGMFPSLPGVYYIEIYSRDRLAQTLSPAEFANVLATEGDKNFYFYVDPLISSRREPLLTSTGTETSAMVMNAPLLEGSFRLLANGSYLETGRRFVLEASESLEVGPVSDSVVDLGLPVGKVSPTVTSSNQEPFTILANDNDVLDFTFDGLNVSVTLTPGARTAQQIAQDLRNGLYQSGIPAQDIDVTALDDGSVRLTAHDTLSFAADVLSTANPTLGFTEGVVAPRLEGRIFPEYAEREATIPLTVNGTTVTFDIFRRSIDPTSLATRFQNGFDPGDLTVTVEAGGDYTVDPTTGEVTLTRPLVAGTRLEADYKYPIASRGPFGLDRDTSNNKAIPGVVLAFGKQLRDGDKQAVVVHDSRVQAAKEYGGRWDVNIDLDIITRDPMTREEISDLLLMYFFAVRKEALTEEGLELLDISFGGEVEETYDETGQDYYFNASISLTFQTDWAIHVPLPLTIERIVPTSFQARAESAATGEPPVADLFRPMSHEEVNLQRVGKMYLKGRDSDFESIS